MKHDLKEKEEPPKSKRFKVVKACYTCRVKKIKCDGVQPCMQCKARKRPCTFSKDGSTDTNQTESEDHTTITTCSTPSPPRSRASTPPVHSPKQATHHHKKPQHTKRIIAATEILNRLNKAWPGEGKEGKWELDQTKLRRINQPTMISDNHDDHSSYLPSKATQQRLVQLYFKHVYAMFPVLPKRLFYKQFDSPIQHAAFASYLLSPLLVFMVCAHGAARQNLKEANTYYNHAKSIVMDRAIFHEPKLSTVIALTLMSLYESRESPNTTMYSALAFQMCLDLDLMRDYSGNLERDAEANDDDEEDGGADLKELRKRVCWACYTLDKTIHIQTGQPWMLRTKDIELDMPLLQPGDDVAEHGVLEGFVATIKLFQIAERILQPESLQQAGQPVVRTHTHDQMSLNQDNVLLHWLRSLPSHLQWTPQLHTNTNIASLPSTKPSNPMTCQLHLVYNFIELCVLKPYASSTVKSIHQRTTAVATNITRLVSVLSENPVWVFNFAFAVNALIESTLMHLRDCSYENLNLARHARFMFQQAMHATKSLLATAKSDQCITRITQFAAALDQGLTEADANCSSSHALYLNEEEMMTPFVLGSLNARYAEEERQQWSKLDYFANGLVTPPTVKSRSISMSSSMFVPTAPFHDYNGHSAITDNVLQASSSSLSQPTWRISANNTTHMTPDRFQFSKAHTSSNPLDFLNNTTSEAWQTRQTDKSNNTSPSVNNSPNKEPSTYTSDLLPTTSDIAALVAHIQDNTNNDNSDGSSKSSSTNESQQARNWSTANTTESNSNSTMNENENLLYTLLSSQHHRTNNTTPSTTARRTSEPRQYNMQPYMNVGLGIYASAHQHHNDVIRQHLPNSAVNNRSVILSHQAQQQNPP